MALWVWNRFDPVLCFSRPPHLRPSERCSGRWIFGQRFPGNPSLLSFRRNSNAFAGCLQSLFPLSHKPNSTLPFHRTMGFLRAFTLRLILLCFTASLTLALPSHYPRSFTAIRRVIDAPTQGLIADDRSDTTTSDVDQGVVDPGSASDGAGSGFDAPMVLWLSFGLTVGLFLTLGGMRLWRVTKGLAIGLVFAFCGQSSPPSLGVPRLSNRHD